MATSRVLGSALRRLKIQNVRYSRSWSAVSSIFQSKGHHEAENYKVGKHTLGLDINKRWRSGFVEEQAEVEPEETKEDELEEIEDKEDFNTYGISPQTQSALRAHGITKLFPVQYLAYETVRKGDDVIVKARTGTGKTLSYALPLVEKFLNRRKRRGDQPKAIVLTPTRELAHQVEEHIQRLNNEVRVTCIYGGTSYLLQKQAISRGLEIVVGTPGRLKDLIEQGSLDLHEIEHVVLDEVDRMLDMGFQDIVDEILSHCYRGERKPQTLMFSATVPRFVRQAARRYLSDNVSLIDLIGDDNVQSATTVTQMAVQSDYITPILLRNLIRTYCEPGGKTIIFCERRTDCNDISSYLPDAEALHGDIRQGRRQQVLSEFRSGNLNILVTTDVAARGLDIPDVDLVIQTSPPKDKENFIHRTGRTGRAGKPGNAIMIYKHREEHEVQSCEHIAKVEIVRIPVPAIDVQELIRRSARRLQKINTEDAVELFGDMAKQLQAELGTVESLSTALMAMSDLKDYGNRSVLSRSKDYRTFHFQADGEVVSTHQFRQILDDVLGHEAYMIADLVMTKEGHGLVFDVPLNLIKSLKEGIASKCPNATLKKLFQLPDDVHPQAHGYKSNNFDTDYDNRRRRSFRDRQMVDYNDRRTSNFRDKQMERRDFRYQDRNRSFGRDYGRSYDFQYRDRNRGFRRDYGRSEDFGYQDRNKIFKKDFERGSFGIDRRYEPKDHESNGDVNDSFMPYR